MTHPADTDRASLEAEHRALAEAARERASVDHFTRAALEGFVWAILSGVCGKVFWDSVRPPAFFWPLALLSALLLLDVVACWRRGRVALAAETAREARLREVRRALGIDAAPRTTLPTLATQEQRS